MGRPDEITAIQTVLGLSRGGLFVIGLGLGGALESERNEPAARARAGASVASQRREATRSSIAAAKDAGETVFPPRARALSAAGTRCR